VRAAGRRSGAAPRRAGGFTAVELLGVLLVGLIILASIPAFIERYSRMMQGRALSTYVAEVNSAVARWLQDNRTLLPVGTTSQSGVAWLKDAAACGAGLASGAVNYLPCNFPAEGPFGVTVASVIDVGSPLITVTSRFSPAVVLDGQIAQPLINRAVAEARANANTRVSVSQSYNVDGATSEIVAVADTQNPGDPWLRLDGTTAMAGDLDVGGNNIINVNDITTTGDVIMENGTVNSVNEELSDAVYEVLVVSDGGSVPKPTCPAGKVPQIFLSPFQFAGSSSAEPIGAVQAWATSGASSWTANLRILHPVPIGWVRPPASLGRMTAIVKCG